MAITGPVCLPRFIANQVLAHAQRHPRLEVCGFVGARQDRPNHCYPVTNVAIHPKRRFMMDPAEQIAALRQMRERGEELYAIYHSHPTSPPYPSLADLAGAHYPQALYLIISLVTAGTLQMRGFRLQDGGMQEVRLEIAR